MNELLEYEILHAQINRIYTDANAFISVIKLLKFSAPLQGQFISQQAFSRPHKDSRNLLKPLGDVKMDRRQTGQLPDQILETAVGNTFTESLLKNFKGNFFSPLLIPILVFTTILQYCQCPLFLGRGVSRVRRSHLVVRI